MPLPLSKMCADYDDRIAALRAIDVPISDITVADICSRAGISRKRFYTLFGEKEGVFRWYLDLCFTASLYEIGRSFTWLEGIEACLFYIAEENDVFAASYRTRAEPPSRYWPMNQARINEMRATLESKGIKIDQALEVEMELYSATVPSLIRQWVEMSGAISIGEFASCWRDCVPGKLRAALEL